MTGKELIIYIVENNLENEEVFKDGVFIGFMSEIEAAARYGVGVHTILAWAELGWLDYVKIGDKLYFKRHMNKTKEKVNE